MSTNIVQIELEKTKNGRKNDLITKYIPMHEIKHLYPVHAKLHFYSCI